MHAVDEEKAAMRRAMRRLRRTTPISPAMRDAITQHAYDCVAPFTRIALYWALGSEVPTAMLLARLSANEKHVALPFVLGDGVMNMRRIDGDIADLGADSLGNPAPRGDVMVPEIIVCPLLAFDAHGHRLGQGGGYYDRYCARHPDVRRVGLAWSMQQVPQVPRGQHDLALSAIITEQGIITPPETS